MSAPLCLWYLLVCICVQMMSVSCHEPWTNILLGLEGRVLNNGFVCFRRDSHYIAVSFIKIELFLFFFFCPPTVGTLSLCLSDKPTDPRLHTAALQFLATVFAQQTTFRDAEDAASGPQHAAATLSDVLSGPSAERLCDQLLQVRRCLPQSIQRE